MSSFAVPVVRISNVQKHPNADTLSITEVEGCPVIFKSSEFQEGDLAIYIPIEAVVPTDHPAFAFLKSEKHPRPTERIKAKKLRGVFSMGMLIPVCFVADFYPNLSPDELVGKDVASALGIVKYEEPEEVDTVGVSATAPHNQKAVWYRRLLRAVTSKIPDYDVESWRKFKHLFEQEENVGQPIVITEKIHGSNFRCVYTGGKFHVGSHHTWKSPCNAGIYGQAANEYDMAEVCKRQPDKVFYGEVYGDVQDMKYGHTRKGSIALAIFDILQLPKPSIWARLYRWVFGVPASSYKGRWLDWPEVKHICSLGQIPTVPELYVGPYSTEIVERHHSGPSTIPGANHFREGCVVKYLHDVKVHGARCLLKLVSQEYLLRKGGTERH